MPDKRVQPYQDIAFGHDGDVDPAGRDRLLRLDVTDLVMFAHGWNNSPAVADRLGSSFFAPFPGLLSPRVRLGYAGIVWPSMRFTDESVPALDAAAPGVPGAAGEPELGAALDAATREALGGLFPGHGATVERLGRLLAERPGTPEAFTEFGRLTRELTQAPAGGLETCFTEDLPQDEKGPPALLFEDALALCRMFTRALAEGAEGAKGGRSGGGLLPGVAGDGTHGLWRGAKELLRQTTYYALKRRAGAVGELGLGPLLGQLARSRPGLRVHLVGHSHGARLVAFALRGLPHGVRTVKSATLLQGAFSHYAFAPSLPHAAQNAGALHGVEQRVDGPVVACYSRHDSALGVIYPLASRLAGDDRRLLGPDRRWQAVGHDGVHAARPPSVRLSLPEALAHGLPRSGFASVDAASVIRRGGPPSGAHSDICHPDLARLVIAAGGLDG